jgi:hypothetical protein
MVMAEASEKGEDLRRWRRDREIAAAISRSRSVASTGYPLGDASFRATVDAAGDAAGIERVKTRSVATRGHI